MRTGLSSGRRLSDRRTSALAAIARREWLLQMLALSAAGCGRGEDRTASRATTLTMAVGEIRWIKPDVTDLDQLIFLPLATRNERGDLEGRLAERWGTRQTTASGRTT